MPYISASIFMQIAGAVIPTVEKMQKDEEGRKKLTQWTRYVTVLLALVQAWGFALFTESLQGAVANPGFGFKLQMVLFLTTGAIFVMWLGEQITERGLGNGASLHHLLLDRRALLAGHLQHVPLRAARARSARSRCSCSAIVMVGGRGRRRGDHDGGAARS